MEGRSCLSLRVILCSWERHPGCGVVQLGMPGGERPAHLSVTIASASLNTSFEYTPAAWKKHHYLRKC
ncbi:unnamed protein product, partial [Bubo scandiacus]